MTKRIVLALVVAAVATIAATALAAPQATLILRNGSRITCELVDLGGVGFTIRVNGIEQRIPADQVAVIDFTGGTIPASEAGQVQDGRALVVFRSGGTLTGSLYDIGGNDPLRITIRTSGGDRDLSSNETARIYLARWDGMPSSDTASGGQTQQQGNRGQRGTGASGNTQQQDTAGTYGSGQQRNRGQRGTGQQYGQEQGGAGISVPANQCWTSTGIIVAQNQPVTFEGSGEIWLGEGRDDVAGVGGSKIGRYVRNAPMRGVLAGALLGRVAYGRPFGIGDQRQALLMPADGVLFLGINDSDCGNNSGEFRVQISTSMRRR